MRPPITLLTRPPVWLGGGTHLRQLADTVRSGRIPGDQVVEVGSLRAPGAQVRLPAGAIARLGPAGLRTVGTALWRGHPHVHRASIEIPPARDELLGILDLAPRRFPDEGGLPTWLGDQARRARGVAVSTQVIADEVRSELGVDAIWFVPPAVESRFFGSYPDPTSGAPYLLHVGGATRRKGLDRLAEAWAAVHDVEPELELVLVGPPHATGRSTALGQPRVRYLGEVGDDRVASLMAHARAVVVPSTYEGFGMPVAEAMALGTPVVVVGGTAPAELGGDVAFVAAPEGGADALAEAVVSAARATENEPGRLSAGRTRAERWSVAAVAEQQQRVYDEAFG